MERAALALLVSLAFLTAWPALHGQFIWDDLTFVRDHPLVNSPGGLRAIWASFATEDYWPLSYSLFWLERFWFGNETLGYHVVAVALHAATGYGIWGCIKRLGAFGRGAFGPAWVAAAVFVVHPVNTEVAAWIFQQKTSLCACLMFASLYAWLRAIAPTERHPRRFIAISWLLFGLAMTAKSSAVLLPVALMGGLWLVPKDSVSRRRAVYAVAGLAGLAGFFGGLSFWAKVLHTGARAAARTDDTASRLWVAAKALGFYLGKALLPMDLSAIYARWNAPSSGFEFWLPFLSIAFVAVSLAAAWRWWGSRLIAVCLGYMVIMLVPCLGFVDISFMRYAFVADHWQYLSIIGPILGVVLGLDHLLGLGGQGALFKVLRLAVVTLGLATLSYLSWQRAMIFTSEEAMWRATIATNPSAFLAQNNLGMIEHDRGKLELAAQHYESALKDAGLQKANADVLGGIAYNLAQVFATLSRREEALDRIQAAIHWLPDFAQAHWLRADLLRAQGDAAGAIAEYRVASELAPQLTAVHGGLGEAMRVNGQLEAALVELELAVRQQPDKPEWRQSLGLAYSELGRHSDSVEQFKVAVEKAPHDFSHRMNLGFAYASLGDWDQAIAAYQAAVVAAPERLDGRIALVKVLAHRGLKAQALSELESIRDWQSQEPLRQLHQAIAGP
ncbi:MAG: tetratricopeptide repeat protein [Proteobacteria bacterium]|nr:tetratricopeptide repeat protein [Pseudomonadota bacterium]